MVVNVQGKAEKQDDGPLAEVAAARAEADDAGPKPKPPPLGQQILVFTIVFVFIVPALRASL